MTEQELQNIEKILPQLTDGPWYVRVIPGKGSDYTAYVCRQYLGQDDVIAACVGDSYTNAKLDAEFIAAAREAVPDVLVELARLRAVLAACLRDVEAGQWVAVRDALRTAAGAGE